MSERVENADLSGLRIDRQSPSSSRPKAPRWMAVVVVLIGIGLAVGWLALDRRAADAPASGNEFEVFRVPQQTARGGVALSGSGYIEAQVTADLSAKIPGRLEFLEVEEGDHVTKGQLIAQLENADYQARVELTERELLERQAAVAEAAAVLVEDQREVERRQLLVSEGISGQATLDRAVARRDASKARLELAKASLESARARVAVSKADLQNTLIRAPFAGIVVRKMAKVGEMVMPQSIGSDTNTKSGIVQIADFDTLEVEVDIQESNIARLVEGQPARVTLKSHRDRPYQGVLRQILPTANRAQGTVLVRVRILDADPLVLPKMQADVDFLIEEADELVVEPIRVPATSVARRNGETVVFLVDDDSVSARVVQTGEALGNDILIVNGLNGGEVIARVATDVADRRRVTEGESR